MLTGLRLQRCLPRIRRCAVAMSAAPASAASAAGAPAVVVPPLVPAPAFPGVVYRDPVPSTPSTEPAAPGDRFVCGPALSLQVDAVSGRARALTLQMPHGPLRTPVFMPVGTKGTIKGLTTAELQLPPLDCDIILGNTYHLADRPGGDTMEALGGLHDFMKWPRNILTDSGGFQMVSLLALAEITEEGVTFASPVDGSRMLLTPEQSIGLQNQIGSDIMMALDDVVDAKTVDAARFTEACHRTLRWIDRCISAHAKPTKQNLFGIVQGGLDVAPGGLRDVCLAGMKERDAKLPGYAIGGLAGGEEKDAFWRVVDHCTAGLPKAKPCYLMGVGYPLDIVVCTGLGVDMYDCVYPTRTARFGTALVHGGLLKLKAAGMKDDHGPIDPTCPCYVCAGGGTTAPHAGAPAADGAAAATSSASPSPSFYSRSQLNGLFRSSETTAAQLVTYHNVAYMMRLVREMRLAIAKGVYDQYVRAFVHNMFPLATDIPVWVVDACAAAGIPVLEPATDAWCKSLFEGTPVPNSVPSAAVYVGTERLPPSATAAGGDGDDDGAASAAAGGAAAAAPAAGKGACKGGKAGGEGKRKNFNKGPATGSGAAAASGAEGGEADAAAGGRAPPPPVSVHTGKHARERTVGEVVAATGAAAGGDAAAAGSS